VAATIIQEGSMLGTRLTSFLALVSVSFAGTSALAQGRPVEIGQDMGFSVTFDGSTVTQVSIPAGDVRVGFYVADRVEIEPQLSLSYTHVSGGSLTVIGFDLTGLIHFTADRTRAQPFFQPIVGIRFVDGGGSSASQFQAGAGIGAKLPVAERLAFRIEGIFAHYFKNNNFAEVNAVGARLGLSFFTH
jgi:hypothetical protein